MSPFHAQSGPSRLRFPPAKVRDGGARPLALLLSGFGNWKEREEGGRGVHLGPALLRKAGAQAGSESRFCSARDSVICDGRFQNPPEYFGEKKIKRKKKSYCSSCGGCVDTAGARAIHTRPGNKKKKYVHFHREINWQFIAYNFWSIINR